MQLHLSSNFPACSSCHVAVLSGIPGHDRYTIAEEAEAQPARTSPLKHLWSRAEPLAAEELRRVVGEGAADADGKGNINAGDGGVAFLLASAGALPGACDAVRWWQ